MGTVGGTSRHYRGGARDPESPGVGPWVCPSCGTQNTTPMEGGCLACGVGTPEEAERARAAGAAAHLPSKDLQRALCGEAELHTAVAFPQLDPKARLTLAKALVFYAEAGSPTVQELSRVYTLAWGRAVFAALPEDEEQ